MAALVCVNLESARHYREGGSLPHNCTQPCMGFPITEAVIDSCCGVTCCMSRGALVPSGAAADRFVIKVEKSCI